MAAYKSGRIAAEFRGVTPPQRDDLVEALGDRVTVSESPWLANLTGRLQHQAPALRRCAGAARAVAGDRPLGRCGKAAEDSPFSNMSAASCDRDQTWRPRRPSWSRLPGFRRDVAAARAQAKRLLDEAGVQDLEAHPHSSATSRCRITPAPICWSTAGTRSGSPRPKRNVGIFDWQKEVDAGRFRRGARFLGRFLRRSDDPADEVRVARSVAGQLLRLDRPLSRRSLISARRSPTIRGSAPGSCAISSGTR